MARCVPYGPGVCRTGPACAVRARRVPYGPGVCRTGPACAVRARRVPYGPGVCRTGPACAVRARRVPYGPGVCRTGPACAVRARRVPYAVCSPNLPSLWLVRSPAFTSPLISLSANDLLLTFLFLTKDVLLSPQPNADHHEMMSGQHNWYASSHARPTYCNVCRDALSGVTSHGLSCEGTGQTTTGLWMPDMEHCWFF